MTEQIPENIKVPRIDITERNLLVIVEQVWKALIQANSPPRFFHHANRWVRVTLQENGVIRLDQLDKKKLHYELVRLAEFVYTKKGEMIIDLPPHFLVDDLLADPKPRLPVMNHVASAPIFSEGGHLRVKPGYDPETQCYLTMNGASFFSELPVNPKEHLVIQAKNLINELLHDFPLIGPAEKAHAIALFLTPFVRLVIEGPIPLTIVEAPCPGTGKTLLVQVLTYPFTGQPLEAMSESRNNEEIRKRITAKLLQAATYIYIDNVIEQINSSALAAAITSTVLEDRQLGFSRILRLPVNCVWVVTGNNPALSAEMSRRSVRVRLDTGKEQPWLRDPGQYKHPNLMNWVKKHRQQLVWSALVLIRNWFAQGKPVADQPSLGMFEGWCRVIGGILKVNGIPGFLENLDTLYTTADMETAHWRNFTENWFSTYARSSVGVARLYELVLDKDIPIDLGSGSEHSKRIRLGLQISKMRQRQFGDYRIVPGKEKNHAQTWRLELVG